jgi:hypothetical protein
MAEGGRPTRAAGWLLLGFAAVALAGCFERHDPGNPFIGPFGDATEGSFGALPAAATGQDLARAPRPDAHGAGRTDDLRSADERGTERNRP